MRNFVFGSVAAIVVLGFGSLCYFELGLAPIAADAAPSALEAGLMNSAVHASVRRRAPDIANPVPPTDDTLIAGGKLYLYV